jgi:hypothetical protein
MVIENIFPQLKEIITYFIKVKQIKIIHSVLISSFNIYYISKKFWKFYETSESSLYFSFNASAFFM